MRKAAQHAVSVILKSGNEREDHPAAAHVGKFCVSCIETAAASPSSQTTLLHALTFLKEVIATIPKHQLKVKAVAPHTRSERTLNLMGGIFTFLCSTLRCQAVQNYREATRVTKPNLTLVRLN